MDPVRMLILTLIVNAIPWLLFIAGLHALSRSPLGHALAQPRGLPPRMRTSDDQALTPPDSVLAPA